MPKELIPAIARRPSRRGQARREVTSSTGLPASAGLGESTCSVAGMTPLRRASAVLISPTSPAVASVWPRFDFAEPTRHGRSAGRPLARMTSPIAVSSTSSPTAVPAPWASM